MSKEKNYDQTDPLIGVLIDERYRVTRRLARGGMATVYVAHDERLDRPVALKVMHPHLAESSDFVARFRREARSAARIVHPGVVSVFDQGVIHDQGFLVMELIDGTNLRALLRAQGALTIAQTLRYTTDILEALRAAHRMGVIHRDIKPENILIPSEGPAKVTDFGLAKAASEVSMSSTGNMLGTVAYIAPEIAITTNADARSDLYSVGIMMYEMLTGSVPWAGESPLQIASHHVSDDVPAPSMEQSWIPREIDDAVAALTARDADSRPANADEAIELISRTAAAIPAQLIQRRADVLPTGGGSEEARTEVLASTQFTRPLPPPAAPTSQAVIHTSASLPTAEAPAPVRRRRRVVLLVSLLLTLLVASGIGGRWWWSEYGPGSYVTMPETTNRPLPDVQADLQSLGLSFRVDEEFSDDIAAGNVTRSDPSGSAQVHKRSEVQIFVSRGVDMRHVPDLAGLTQSAATTALEEAGLALGTVEQTYSETVPEGQVISQGTPAGQSIAHDSPISVVISQGREPITVPDLSQMRAQDARTAIESLGLTAVPTEAFDDNVTEGNVISQQTTAGMILHRGDNVSYTVSRGPERIPVPNVVGRQQEEARRILEDAGFQVSENRVLGGFFGTVRASDPQAGEQAVRGSTITITIV